MVTVACIDLPLQVHENCFLHRPTQKGFSKDIPRYLTKIPYIFSFISDICHRYRYLPFYFTYAAAAPIHSLPTNTLLRLPIRQPRQPTRCKHTIPISHPAAAPTYSLQTHYSTFTSGSRHAIPPSYPAAAPE